MPTRRARLPAPHAKSPGHFTWKLFGRETPLSCARGCGPREGARFGPEVSRRGQIGRRMDLKIYYQKVREKRASIAEAFPVVVSQETGDGGKDGVLTEVTPDLAAKMIVDGTAHLASAEEAA